MSSVLPLPLAPFEEYLLLDDRPGYRMTFLVDQSFDGEIDRDAFDRGVTEASRRHPLLNAFVKRRWYGRRDWVSAGGARPAVDWGHIDQPVDFPEDSGIDLTREVGARFHVRVGNGRSRLITTFHHSCCDGMGAIQFLSDLFAAYTRHLAPNAQKHPAYQPVEERHLLHRGYLPILHDAVFNNRERPVAAFVPPGGSPPTSSSAMSAAPGLEVLQSMYVPRSARSRNGSNASRPDRKSTRLNSSHVSESRMPSSA